MLGLCNKQVACVLLLVVIAIVPPLYLTAYAWPIPVRVGRIFWFDPWWQVQKAPLIYVVEVESIEGLVWRQARLRVLSTVKGQPLPPQVRQRLGIVAGTGDVGRRFLVYCWSEDRNNIRFVYDVGPQESTSTLSGSLPFNGPKRLALVQDMAHLQAVKGSLDEQAIQSIQGWIADPEKLLMAHVSAGEVIEFLERHNDQEAVRKVLDAYQKAIEIR